MIRLNDSRRRLICLAAVAATLAMSFVPADRERSFREELSEAISGDGFGSPAEDLRAEYESQYERARRQKLSEVDHCEACGQTARQLAKAGGHLETHHKKPVLEIFRRGLDRSLIYDPGNMIVLCRNGLFNCHFRIGHDPDGPGPRSAKFSESNPNVERDARNFAKSLRK